MLLPRQVKGWLLKSIVVVFAAFLLIMATSPVFAAIDDARNESTTENFQGLTSSNSTANVTLGSTLSQNSLSEVSTITSNLTLDTPTKYAYNSASRVLTINGLAESGYTRTLAVTYNIASTIVPAGMSSFFTLLYWFWIMIIVGLSGGAIYAFFNT